jgi:hypothetical protein
VRLQCHFAHCFGVAFLTLGVPIAGAASLAASRPLAADATCTYLVNQPNQLPIRATASDTGKVVGYIPAAAHFFGSCNLYNQKWILTADNEEYAVGYANYDYCKLIGYPAVTPSLQLRPAHAVPLQ